MPEMSQENDSKHWVGYRHDRQRTRMPQLPEHAYSSGAWTNCWRPVFTGCVISHPKQEIFSARDTLALCRESNPAAAVTRSPFTTRNLRIRSRKARAAFLVVGVDRISPETSIKCPERNSSVSRFVRLSFGEKEGFNPEAVVLGRLRNMRRVYWEALHT